MKGRGRDLVIDADIGRSAANPERLARALVLGEGDARPAFARRRALDAILEARHRAVFGPTLYAEWHRRPAMAGAARMGSGVVAWLARMRARGLIVHLSSEPDAGEWMAAIAEVLPEHERPAAEKDAHLVAAATAHDRRVISCDDRARARFAKIACHPGCHALAVGLHWCNPVDADGAALRWLKARAPDDPAFALTPPQP